MLKYKLIGREVNYGKTQTSGNIDADICIAISVWYRNDGAAGAQICAVVEGRGNENVANASIASDQLW